MKIIYPKFSFFSDTLPSRPKYFNAENITEKSLLMRWTMDTNSVNPIEFYNINVTLISELDHPDEKTNNGRIDLYGNYRDDFESKTYKVSIIFLQGVPYGDDIF